MNITLLYNMSGGNVSDATARLGGEEYAKRFVKKFSDDKTFENLKNAMAGGNADEAFCAAHTIKGLAATLGFENLRAASSELTEILRKKTFDGANDAFKKVENEYGIVISAIKELD